MEYIYEEQKGPGPCKDFQTLSLSGAKSFEAQEKMVVETMRAAAAGRPAGSARVSRRFNRTGGGMLITAYGPVGRPASRTVSSFPSKNGAGSHRINGPICHFLHLFIHVQELDLYPLCSLGFFELLGSVGSLGPRQPGIRHKNKKTVEMFDESKHRERERHKIIITARQI